MPDMTPLDPIEPMEDELKLHGFSSIGYTLPYNNGDHKGMFRALKWEIINAGLSSDLLSYLGILEQHYNAHSANADKLAGALKDLIFSVEEICPHRSQMQYRDGLRLERAKQALSEYEKKNNAI